MSTNHQPWDNGAIDATLKSVLGFGSTQKTITTRCNKRVSFAQADYTKPVTCFQCRESINSEKEFILEQAIALNATNILHSIADRTCDHAISAIDDSEAKEIIMQAWEKIIAEQIAKRQEYDY